MSFGEHGGFVRGLDAWIEREDDCGDPGHGGLSKLPLLRCTGCEVRCDFTGAVAHFRLTGHTFTYKGTLQDFAKFAVTPGECEVRR